MQCNEWYGMVWYGMYVCVYMYMYTHIHVYTVYTYNYTHNITILLEDAASTVHHT